MMSHRRAAAAAAAAAAELPFRVALLSAGAISPGTATSAAAHRPPPTAHRPPPAARPQRRRPATESDRPLSGGSRSSASRRRPCRRHYGDRLTMCRAARSAISAECQAERGAVWSRDRGLGRMRCRSNERDELLIARSSCSNATQQMATTTRLRLRRRRRIRRRLRRRRRIRRRLRRRRR